MLAPCKMGLNNFWNRITINASYGTLQIFTNYVQPNSMAAWPTWDGQINSDDFMVELVSKELNHFAAILHVYAGGLNFMK